MTSLSARKASLGAPPLAAKQRPSGDSRSDRLRVLGSLRSGPSEAPCRACGEPVARRRGSRGPIPYQHPSCIDRLPLGYLARKQAKHRARIAAAKEGASNVDR